MRRGYGTEDVASSAPPILGDLTPQQPQSLENGAAPGCSGSAPKGKRFGRKSRIRSEKKCEDCHEECDSNKTPGIILPSTLR